MTDNALNQAQYRVLYADIDSMDVMYYGNYYRLFELGRSEFIRERGMSYKEIEERGAALPVTESHCHYHGSAMYDDFLLIETRIGIIRRASVRFDYEIFRDETRAERLVEGYTMHACVSPEKKIIRLPEFLKEMLS